MEKLLKLRKKIDQIDQKLSQLLEKRLAIIEAIREIKKADKKPIIDKSREKEILDKVQTKYQKEIFKKIIEQGRKVQKEPRTNF